MVQSIEVEISGEPLIFSVLPWGISRTRSLLALLDADSVSKMDASSKHQTVMQSVIDSFNVEKIERDRMATRCNGQSSVPRD